MNLEDTLNSGEAKVIGVMLSAVKEDMGDMKAALLSINATLSKLAGLEVEHVSTKGALDRAFGELMKVNERMEKIDVRMQKVEVVMPQLIETRKWVVSVVVAAAIIIMSALVALVIRPSALQIPADTQIVTVPKK